VDADFDPCAECGGVYHAILDYTSDHIPIVMLTIGDNATQTGAKEVKREPKCKHREC
jgi:hypothetical protein